TVWAPTDALHSHWAFVDLRLHVPFANQKFIWRERVVLSISTARVWLAIILNVAFSSDRTLAKTFQPKRQHNNSNQDSLHILYTPPQPLFACPAWSTGWDPD